MPKIAPTRKTILKRKSLPYGGYIALLLLEREGTQSAYAVSVPPKLGAENMAEQFLTLKEANEQYNRYVQFFEMKGQ